MSQAPLPSFSTEVLVDCHDRVGESPVWSPLNKSLYWVDIEGRRLHRWSEGDHRDWPLPDRTGCIALHRGGGLLAAMEAGIHRLWPGTTGREPRIELVAPAPFGEGMRFNDGRCDRAGRFWVSSMVMDMSLARPDGVLYRLDNRGLVPMVTGLITGNGLGFSPDGRTMYLSDSHPTVQRIWAFDLDANGELSNRRLFVDMNEYPGRPDGAAVDRDGGYWICGNDAGRVLRFTPRGALDRMVSVPLSKPSMCSFGGERLDDLFITSITPGQPSPDFPNAPDGALLRVRTGYVGLDEVPFAY